MTAKTLLDTDILSLLIRKQIPATIRARQYLSNYPQYTFSLITRYKILRGLKAKNAQKKLADFNFFCQYSEILPVNDKVIECASSIYADLHQRGQLIGDADLLIAATAIEYDLVLSTNNENHFSRIPGLTIDNWSKISPVAH